MQEIAKGQSSIYFDITRLFFTLKLLLVLTCNSISCIFFHMDFAALIDRSVEYLLVTYHVVW